MADNFIRAMSITWFTVQWKCDNWEPFYVLKMKFRKKKYRAILFEISLNWTDLNFGNLSYQFSIWILREASFYIVCSDANLVVIGRQLFVQFLGADLKFTYI